MTCRVVLEEKRGLNINIHIHYTYMSNDAFLKRTLMNGDERKNPMRWGATPSARVKKCTPPCSSHWRKKSHPRRTNGKNASPATCPQKSATPVPIQNILVGRSCVGSRVWSVCWAGAGERQHRGSRRARVWEKLTEYKNATLFVSQFVQGGIGFASGWRPGLSRFGLLTDNKWGSHNPQHA